MKKIIIITTVPLSLATLVKGQAKYLSQFFDVKLVTSSGEANKEIEIYEGVELTSIDMTRKISPFADLNSLRKLYSYIRSEKPDMVYTFTPKAGLLGSMAAFLARVPTRIHNVVGMPLMESHGAKKLLLQFIEKLTYFFTTRLFCNSYGLKEYIQNNLSKKEIQVIGEGSINGVNTDFFSDTFSPVDKQKIKESHNIDDDSFVITFVGRIVRDKGVNELVEAFDMVREKHKQVKLLLVGDYEENLNPIRPEIMTLINESEDIISVGFQKDIRSFLAISDLFVLPSYREGLPNSLIEAGSYGIPLVETNINGCNEIIIENETGVLVEKKSSKSLAEGILKLIDDEQLYKEIESTIRDSMIQRFGQEYFWKQLKDELENSF
jgi:glycosyltransferase involved in cell wall biosynthesis